MDGIWDGGPIIHLPAAGGRGSPHQAWRVPHFVRRKLGSYGRAWLRWLDREGSTSAVPLAHFCSQGAAYLQMVMATALSGCDIAHARWHAWRRGGSAALRWLGLPVRWLARWGRWMSESVAAHYGDAPDDFVVADDVELPWPSARGGTELEWSVVSLKDMFPGEVLALCVREKDVGPEEVLGRWRDAEATAESHACRSRRDDGGGQGDSQPAGGCGTERSGESVTEAGTRGSWMSLWPSRPCKGDRGPSGLADVGRERTSSTSMLSPPPPHRQAPPLSVGSGSRHTGRAELRRSWERGKQRGRPGLWVRLPDRQFPAESAVDRWAPERLQCGEWDAWLRDLRACLPRAPPCLLERRLSQFVDWGVEAARDLRQPDFLPLIATALSSLDSGV